MDPCWGNSTTNLLGGHCASKKPMANGDTGECFNDSRGTTGALAVAWPGSCRRADGRPVRCRGHYGAVGCSISKRALAVSRNWRPLQGSWGPSASAGVVSASLRGRAHGTCHTRSTGRHWADGPGGSVTTLKYSGGACTLPGRLRRRGPVKLQQHHGTEGYRTQAGGSGTCSIRSHRA